MAIYHLNARSGSRQRNSSAKAKAQYVTRTGDYSTRKDLVFATSGNMPTWAEAEPITYWEAADQYERANACLFREYEFALPVELTQEQNQALALEFAEFICEDRLPYTLAIHDQGKGNPHAHLVFSERMNDGIPRTEETWFKRAANKNRDLATGGAKKVDLSSKAKLLEIRATWSDLANEALEHAQVDARIDHRSHAERGLNLIPQIHLGAATTALNRKNKQTPRNDKYEEIKRKNEERAEKIAEIERLSRELEILEEQDLLQALKSLETEENMATFKEFIEHYELENTAEAKEQYAKAQANLDVFKNISVEKAYEFIDSRINNFDFKVFIEDEEMGKDFNKALHDVLNTDFADINKSKRDELHNYIDEQWENKLIATETELQLQEREAQIRAENEDQKENGPKM